MKNTGICEKSNVPDIGGVILIPFQFTRVCEGLAPRKDAVDKVGDKDVQFLDVRDDDTYKAGHLKGTLQCSLKEFDTPEAQTEMYNLAKDKMDKDESVYILCYSGNKCAKTAISVMKDAGFDTDNLFIIENGAKDGDVSAAFVTE